MSLLSLALSLVQLESLFISLSNKVPCIRIMHMWDDQHIWKVDEVHKKMYKISFPLKNNIINIKYNKSIHLLVLTLLVCVGWGLAYRTCQSYQHNHVVDKISSAPLMWTYWDTLKCNSDRCQTYFTCYLQAQKLAVKPCRWCVDCIYHMIDDICTYLRLLHLHRS